MQRESTVLGSICAPTSLPIRSDGSIFAAVVDSSISENDCMVGTENQSETGFVAAVSVDVLAVSECLVGVMLLREIKGADLCHAIQSVPILRLG